MPKVLIHETRPAKEPHLMWEFPEMLRNAHDKNGTKKRLDTPWCWLSKQEFGLNPSPGGIFAKFWGHPFVSLESTYLRKSELKFHFLILSSSSKGIVPELQLHVGFWRRFQLFPMWSTIWQLTADLIIIDSWKDHERSRFCRKSLSTNCFRLNYLHLRLTHPCLTDMYRSYPCFRGWFVLPCFGKA